MSPNSANSRAVFPISSCRNYELEFHELVLLSGARQWYDFRIVLVFNTILNAFYTYSASPEFPDNFPTSIEVSGADSPCEVDNINGIYELFDIIDRMPIWRKADTGYFIKGIWDIVNSITTWMVTYNEAFDDIPTFMLIKDVAGNPLYSEEGYVLKVCLI